MERNEWHPEPCIFREQSTGLAPTALTIRAAGVIGRSVEHQSHLARREWIAFVPPCHLVRKAQPSGGIAIDDLLSYCRIRKASGMGPATEALALAALMCWTAGSFSRALRCCARAETWV